MSAIAVAGVGEFLGLTVRLLQIGQVASGERAGSASCD
jgi:hypothetical protein